MGADADGSNTARDFEIELKITKEMLNSFHITPTDTRVGLLLYGRNAIVAVHLNTYRSKAELEDLVKTLKNYGNGNRMDKALNLSRTDMFNENKGARKGIPKSLVIFSNKKSDVNPIIEAQKLRDLGVKIVTIGVGQHMDKDELFHISGKKDQVFNAKNLEEVGNVVAAARRAVLPGGLSIIYCQLQYDIIFPALKKMEGTVFY